MIQITEKLYKELLEDSRTLAALEAAGVNNWEGYSEAFPDDEDEEDGEA